MIISGGYATVQRTPIVRERDLTHLEEDLYAPARDRYGAGNAMLALQESSSRLGEVRRHDHLWVAPRAREPTARPRGRGAPEDRTDEATRRGGRPVPQRIDMRQRRAVGAPRRPAEG